MLIFLSVSMPAFAQELSPNDDYDVLVIPGGGAATVLGTDFRAATLLERGLTVDSVPGFILAETPSVGEDTLTVRLGEGQGIRLLSGAIPISSASVYFSMIASATGEPPQQAALAILDVNDPSRQAVSISFSQEFPYDKQNFSLEYQRNTDAVMFLIQLVGPATGESAVTLKRIRVLDGFQEVQFALGSTAITAVEHFGQGTDSVTTNLPPSTAGGWFSSYPGVNRTSIPMQEDRSLLIGTSSADDVIQITIPLQRTVSFPDDEPFPVRMYGRVYARRISGFDGIFSVALFSGMTGSGGYTNYPVSTLKSSEWLSVETRTVFSKESAQVPLLILQLQGGPAKVAVDDVSLNALRDSTHFWDAGILDRN